MPLLLRLIKLQRELRSVSQSFLSYALSTCAFSCSYGRLSSYFYTTATTAKLFCDFPLYVLKVKYLRGVFFGGVGHLSDQIFHAPGAKYWHYAAELRTLSVTYLLCGSPLTDTMDILSQMCPLKLTDFCLFLYHRSKTILQGAQTGYCQTTQPLQLALRAT